MSLFLVTRYHGIAFYNVAPLPRGLDVCVKGLECSGYTEKQPALVYFIDMTCDLTVVTLKAFLAYVENLK